MVSYGFNVSEVIMPSEEGGLVSTIERTVEMPAEVTKIQFKGPDAEVKMQEYVQSISGGKSLQEVESVDASGNVIHKRVIQQRLSYPENENWVLVCCKNVKILTPYTQTPTINPNSQLPLSGHHVIQSNKKMIFQDKNNMMKIQIQMKSKNWMKEEKEKKRTQDILIVPWSPRKKERIKKKNPTS